MKKDRIQHIFIYITGGVLLLVVLGFGSYIGYETYRWRQYKKDDAKKPLIEAIEALYERSRAQWNADDYIALGNAYSGLGEDIKAIKAYRASLDLRENIVAYNNLANKYREIGAYREAEQVYVDSIVFYGNDPRAYVSLYDLYKIPWLGKRYSPEGILQLGLEKMPEQPSLLVNLANYYKEIGDIPRAVEYFERTVASDPSNEAAQRDLDKLRMD